ncbi:hypothetical protein KSZ74_22905, partial [Parabacteroides distasonis]
DWTWNGDMPLSAKYQGKELTLQVTARFNNGETAYAESAFIVRPEQVKVSLGADWNNLLGTSTHVAPVCPPLEAPLQLAW